MDEIDAIGGRRNARDQQYIKMTLNQVRPEGEYVLLARASPRVLSSRLPHVVPSCDLLIFL